MAAERVLPDASELKRMVDSGMTQQDIADEVHRTRGVRVTRAAVSAALSRAGHQSYRKRYPDLIPWRVRVEHNKEYHIRMLRLEARRRSGEALPRDEERKLDRWLQILNDNNAVIHYDPRGADLNPPVAGFYMVPRRDGVDRDIIRYPDEMLSTYAR